MVNLDHADIDDETSLYLDATGNSGYDGVATIVFGVNNGNLQHLVTAKNGPASIPDLKQYYDNGTRQFLVVVVNSMHNGTDYLGNSNIELKLEVKKEEIHDYNYCSVTIRSVYDLHREHALDGSSYDFTDALQFSQGYWGTIENGEFSSSPSQNSNNDYTYEGSITISINNDMNMVTNFSVTSTITKPKILYITCPGSDTQEIQKFDIEGGNIPFSDYHISPYGPVLEFEIAGANTCGHLTVNDYECTRECTNPYSGTWDDTVEDVSTGYSCDSGSRVKITFSKR